MKTLDSIQDAAVDKCHELNLPMADGLLCINCTEKLGLILQSKCSSLREQLDIVSVINGVLEQDSSADPDQAIAALGRAIDQSNLTDSNKDLAAKFFALATTALALTGIGSLNHARYVFWIMTTGLQYVIATENKSAKPSRN